MGLRSGLCADQSSSSTPISTNHFCMDLALCTGELSCWNRKGPSLNCCHKVGSTESSRRSLYAVALRFPFTGTKGPEPWKTTPDHYSSSTNGCLHTSVNIVHMELLVSTCTYCKLRVFCINQDWDRSCFLNHCSVLLNCLFQCFWLPWWWCATYRGKISNTEEMGIRPHW
jgi:hypothetical protein